MNAEEFFLCFILVVDSCECQATNVFDEMYRLALETALTKCSSTNYFFPSSFAALQTTILSWCNGVL